MKKTLIGFSALAAALFLLIAQGRTQTINKADGPSSRPEKPQVIYVTDFAIDTSDITQDRRLLNRPGRMQEDPEAKAQRLVELLSDSLTGELQSRSIPAKRLQQGQSIPNRGWLVQGQFLEAGEGNRVKRAMVGFGAGATDMQIEVSVIDLGSKSSEPFIVFGTESKSGRGPGAVVMWNPYAAAAKFVLSKRAPERDVRKTALQIADVLAKLVEEGGTR
ncbi:MAG: DUF4410 domain-containing protein [Syntrophobacteraceae bacterium]|jgi:hypothetical protein